MVRVTVRRAENELALDVEPNALVSSIKQSVAKEWHIPPTCQELVLNSASLPNVDTVAQHSKGSKPSGNFFLFDLPCHLDSLWKRDTPESLRALTLILHNCGKLVSAAPIKFRGRFRNHCDRLSLGCS